MNFNNKEFVDYFNLGTIREFNINKYLEGLNYINPLSFNKISLQYSYLNKLKSDYSFILQLSSYFSYLNPVKTFFITYTLPGFFHNNPFSYNRGYRLLQDNFRSTLKYFKKMKMKYKYIRVCEFHKDFTPHFHIIFFVYDFGLIGKKRFSKLKNKFIIETFRDVIYRYRRNNNIGRTNVLDIDGENGVTKYLAKYLGKSIKNPVLAYALKGWSSKHNIRIFSYSKSPVPRYILNKLFPYFDDFDLQSIKEKGIFKYLEDNLDIDRTFKNINFFPNSTKKYYINVVYDVRKILKYKKMIFLNKSVFFQYVNLNYIYQPDYSHKIFSNLDDLFSEMGVDKEDYIISKTAGFFEVDYNKFLFDFLDYYVEEYKYKYIKDIIIYKFDDLVYKKSLCFLVKDGSNADRR